MLVSNDALDDSAEFDERQAKGVELPFLAGLSVEETADILDVSERTFAYDWRMARFWLAQRLAEEWESGLGSYSRMKR